MSEMTTRAAVLAGSQRIEVKQVPVPKVGPGMMEIAVKACGVCGSDVHMWKAGHGWGSKAQAKDFIMGHEFCGTVTEPGDGPFKVGERVTFWANLYCGKCECAARGRSNCAGQ